MLLGDETNKGIHLTKKYITSPFLQSFFFSWIRVAWCGSKVCQHRVKAMRAGSTQLRVGVQGLCKWSLAVQWLNTEPQFGTETFCLPCLLNSYCMWCSINNVFWNYYKAVLREKCSYWISTMIYLPSPLFSQCPVTGHLIYVFRKCETECSTAFLPILK